MPNVIDMVQLERDIANFVDHQKVLAEGSEFSAVLARMQIAMATAATRWRAEEANRGTSPNEVGNALVCFVASTMQAHICTCEEDRMEQLAIINRMMKAIGEEIGSIRVGARNTVTYRVGVK